jgi:hypothetical protein
MPTHPIRDDKYPAISVSRCVQRVFIALSDSAHVGARRNSKVH